VLRIVKQHLTCHIHAWTNHTKRVQGRSQCETLSAEDYFSDNTQRCKDLECIWHTGVTLSILKVQRRGLSSKKGKPSIGQRIVQAALNKISEAECNAKLDTVDTTRSTDPLDMLPVVRDGVYPYISELL
jgi:hypothetical protein